LSLSEYTHKAQLGDRTRCQFGNAARAKAFHSVCSPHVKLMLHHCQRQQSVNIQ
jgi:hypothetical protein